MKEKLKNLKVRNKLQYAFKAVLAMTAVAIVIGFLCLAATMLLMRSFYLDNYQDSQLQLTTRKNLETVTKDIILASSTRDEKVRTQSIKDANEAAKEFSDNMEVLENTYHNKELVAKVTASAKTVAADREKIMRLISFRRMDEAQTLINQKFSGENADLQNTLAEIGTDADIQAARAYQRIQILGIAAIVLMILSGVLAFAVSRKLSRAITDSITEPVEELEAAAQQLHEGHLDVEIPYHSEDELGMLAHYIRKACRQIHDVVEDTTMILGKMAEKDFNVHTAAEDKYVGDFQALIQSMRKLNRQMDGTLRQITETSEQVASGAEQLAGGAQSLAEGATDQAGAVEELTATVEDVANISDTSAKNSQEAADKVNEAVKSAKVSQQEVEKLTQAMEKIAATSEQIKDIISAIEDIAAQTNLLSLNASIEAARAGDAGRGFAVVADQIGKLASDSAKSAVTTRDLISEAIQEIENGNQITKKTVVVFNEILKSMTDFGEMADGASENAKTQSDMLQQINAGIQQISSTVQNNSSAAEETSAVSEELSAQATVLEKMVSEFKLRTE